MIYEVDDIEGISTEAQNSLSCVWPIPKVLIKRQKIIEIIEYGFYIYIFIKNINCVPIANVPFITAWLIPKYFVSFGFSDAILDMVPHILHWNVNIEMYPLRSSLLNIISINEQSNLSCLLCCICVNK